MLIHNNHYPSFNGLALHSEPDPSHSLLFRFLTILLFAALTSSVSFVSPSPALTFGPVCLRGSLVHDRYYFLNV